jgi:2-oxoglutarate ferredoxin oxidoreductase subunit alpha
MAKKVLMTGNDAMAEGAIRAGCRYYYGYPITPQNEVPEYMSRRMPQVGGVFIQSESELAAVNMVLGSAAAGKRAMTSSSSPGISLKQEGLSYIAGSELPAVIANVQRGGPGLGDIGASQADYWQATKGGGHGDYRLIVLAPASVQEMADLATLAFDIADRWRNPVMILADAQVGQMMEPVVWREYTPPRDLPAKDWALTGADGRPKRIVKSFFLYPGDLEKHNIRLQKKYAEISKREVRYEEVRTKDADLVIIAYGSSARIAKGLVAKGVNHRLALSDGADQGTGRRWQGFSRCGDERGTDARGRPPRRGGPRTGGFLRADRRRDAHDR